MLGFTISNTAKASNYGKMEHAMRAIMSREKNAAMGNLNGPMAASTKVSSTVT